MAKEPTGPRATRPLFTKAAKTIFLTHLAGTAHVARSAQAAGVGVRTVYLGRARDAEFAAMWAAALVIGYERIETALIRKALRLTAQAPLADPESGANVADDEIDVDLAKFLLTRHRQVVTQARADQKKTAGFRASRDGAEATLLAKLRAYAKTAGIVPPSDPALTGQEGER